MEEKIKNLFMEATLLYDKHVQSYLMNFVDTICFDVPNMLEIIMNMVSYSDRCRFMGYNKNARYKKIIMEKGVNCDASGI